MICTLTDVFCLENSLLLIFLVFCKSNVDIILKPNLAIYHNNISSPYSPDSKSPSFRTHAQDNLC